MTQRKRLYQSTVGGDINYDYNNITADTTQTGDVTLTGDTTQTGDVTLTGNTTQTGNVILVGNHTLTGTPTITGNTTQTGNIGLTGNITQTGNINLTGTAAVTGGITATTTIAATGNLSGANFVNATNSQATTFVDTDATFTSGAIQTPHFTIIGNTCIMTFSEAIVCAADAGNGWVANTAIDGAYRPATTSTAYGHYLDGTTAIFSIATDGIITITGMTDAAADTLPIQPISYSLL